ncbi:TonB-dependent receptor [Chryseolinea sp. T2]|uniref:TonB-dependent receptor plug domain-containing protein n=1 Tax=Chryseolinea sp. T2 TaxID=3129255 RepID=UPI0030778537
MDYACEHAGASKYMIQLRFGWLIILATSLVVIQNATGQDSIATKNLDAVIVTATRSERALSELPVPVTVIPASQIRNMGSLRLNDVLVEQTGMAIVSDHGTGVQLQGFSPEYTLIIVDGEPLIGRTSGTLDLTRIAVGNIKQIEVMKGPSSSLYGSEALAGVINIITDRPSGTSGNITTRYGTNETFDLGASLNLTKSKFGLYVFGNHYRTGGYDFDPETVGQTVSPFANSTFQSRLSYKLSDRTQLTISGRYFYETQENASNIGTTTVPLVVDGTGDVTDWNINPVVTHKFTDRLKTTFRFYGSKYGTNSRLTYQQDGALYDDTYFDQAFYRPEIQAEYFFNERNVLSLGVGRIWESVEATRYDDRMKYQTNYVYTQYEWQPLKRLNVLAGLRFDDHSAYGSQLSPKLSLQYDAAKWLAVRASYGVGFKAPDFRQLYLNFTNSTVGYTVLGSKMVEDGVKLLQEQNQIQSILADPSTFGDIKAESSRAYNFGFRLKPLERLTANLNFFRNDVSDLIDTKAVALKNNGQQVYSYYNISEVFTQGVEADVAYSIAGGITISGGYQYLDAKDKTVLDQLKEGTVYARDPGTNMTRRVSEDEYGGLLNRSKHMANAKLFYEHEKTGWSATARIIYRGRYGIADTNNNNILDADSEYVDGYATINISAGKTFTRWLKLQAGCDNLFDYTNKSYISSLPGRLIWASIGLTFAGRSTMSNN